MASRMVELQETVEQSDRCHHKLAQRFFSIPFFLCGRSFGLSLSRDSRWECLRSRDGSKGIVLVGTSRTQVKVKVRQDWRSMTASSLAG